MDIKQATYYAVAPKQEAQCRQQHFKKNVINSKKQTGSLRFLRQYKTLLNAHSSLEGVIVTFAT